MSRSRQNRLLTHLVRVEDWVTAASLADYLGVTPRTVRSYVVALNARVADGLVVESGGQGSAPVRPRVLRCVRAPWSPARHSTGSIDFVRRLLESEAPIDVHDTADEIYVSSATIEADLAKVRSFLSGSGLTLERQGSQVWLQGTEMAQRRLSRLVHDQAEMESLDFTALMRVLGEGSVGAEAYARFKSDLVDALGGLGYFVNEYAIADVLMHVAIAADRIARGRPLAPGIGQLREDEVAVGEVLDELALRHFGIQFGGGDKEFLTTVVLSRVVAPRLDSVRALARERVSPAVEQAVMDACAAAAAEFLIDLSGEDFTWRLILHVQNLSERVAGSAWSRNPLTRTLKASYPMIFEVAVYIANRLQERLGIPLVDEEIAYIAIHVGARLERNRTDDDPPTATIVCPGYHDLDSLLRSSLDRSLGKAIQVVRVETRANPDWAAMDSDLILTTIAPPRHSDRIVTIPLFLSDADVERVHAAGDEGPADTAAGPPAHGTREVLRAAVIRPGPRSRLRRGGHHPPARSAAGRRRRHRRQLRRAEHRAGADVVDGLHRVAGRAARPEHDGDPDGDSRRHVRPAHPLGREPGPGGCDGRLLRQRPGGVPDRVRAVGRGVQRARQRPAARPQGHRPCSLPRRARRGHRRLSQRASVVV